MKQQESRHPDVGPHDIFGERTGLSQATYYRYRERLEKRGQLTPIEPPRMAVQGKPPEPKPKKLETKPE